MIRSSFHPSKYANSGKKELVVSFIQEYRRVMSLILDDIWKNGYEVIIEGEVQRFSIQENKLQLPKYLDYTKFEIDTFLTARAISHLVTQLRGILSASVRVQSKRLYILSKMKSEGIPRGKRSKLINKIKQNIPQKPSVLKVNPELSSKCINLSNSDTSFDSFVKLSSVIKGQEAIYIPINLTSHSAKLAAKGGKIMTSFLLKLEGIDIRWDIPECDLKTEGEIIGADQGIKTILTLSDSQATSADIHGHTLDSIMKRMDRMKRGSKAFKRAQAHRKNHINWSLNQLDFSGIKEIRLERIWNIGYKSKRSSFLALFTNTLIRDKVEDLALQNGVHFIEQDSTYRSQRCCECGLVRKANRKKKIYECSSCGNILDADLNASRNHAADLPEVPYTLRKKNINRGKGFFWKEDGFFDILSGRSLESLPPVKDICLQNI